MWFSWARRRRWRYFRRQATSENGSEWKCPTFHTQSTPHHPLLRGRGSSDDLSFQILTLIWDFHKDTATHQEWGAKQERGKTQRSSEWKSVAVTRIPGVGISVLKSHMIQFLKISWGGSKNESAVWPNKLDSWVESQIKSWITKRRVLLILF